MADNNSSSDHPPEQTLTWRIGNFEVPTVIGHNFGQGFLQNLPTHISGAAAPTVMHRVPLSVISEPSVVVDMQTVSPRYTQAGEAAHSHGHGHSHGGVQDENQNGGLHGGVPVIPGVAGGHAHRHNGNSLNDPQQQDWKPFLEWLQKSGVFFVLLFIKLIYDHRLGMLVFLGLGGTFYYANMKMVHFIHQSAVRETHSRCAVFPWQPVWLVIFLSLNIGIIFYVFREQSLWNVLIMKMPSVSEVDIWTLLWIVLLIDYIIKFATIIVKALVSLVPHSCLPHRRRGKYFMFLEHLSQYYRNLIPILPWIHFLTDDENTGRWFSTFLVIVYMIFKTNILWGLSFGIKKAFQRLRVNTAFGIKPNSEDLKCRADPCPICQDDVKDPVMLPCKHIFCENCVSVWFDRERTCPMCRAEITENPVFQDGSTSIHLQWY
ncbi:E3 ubiquitin-protein ligase RNFT1-like [Gigantopelta aegis]|uniref:E3 ubiquitin-protein ligase RNFT1-like n=1 Tax=Gigantopelta aegis TaxID=1735272 RepID=UPI001B88E30D|nr:E3 ubiquitin-protein ligase RNFT1-like [Gigantopelta aegis]